MFNLMTIQKTQPLRAMVGPAFLLCGAQLASGEAEKGVLSQHQLRQ